ncbi:hypothetical protein DQ04_03191080 [Trypanosoma grayi]|uniref:hypothetical protein n=1 Tax=Trypanosoma grayi TaxID=71804 RepID=UPI0004F4410F|nr:hypothetical protein DQ04_03191080 [Trypanosoma grayi]KEG10884.1 hypothetical protein DQ04_03191080 [Trypanosoma grayi]
MSRGTLAPQVSCAGMRFLKKRLQVRCAADCSHKSVFTREEFIALCTSNPYVPISERMTLREAEDFLQTLHRAREVIMVRGCVYTKPSDVVDAVHIKAHLPKLLHGTHACSSQHVGTHSGSAATCAPKNVTCRRDFWAAISLISGSQMTLLAYLTFIVYDWDVMEPICYFVTTFTALSLYAYSLVFRRECSFNAVDNQLFPWTDTSVAELPHANVQICSDNSASCSVANGAELSLVDAADLLHSLDVTTTTTKDGALHRG